MTQTCIALTWQSCAQHMNHNYKLHTLMHKHRFISKSPALGRTQDRVGRKRLQRTMSARRGRPLLHLALMPRPRQARNISLTRRRLRARLHAPPRRRPGTSHVIGGSSYSRTPLEHVPQATVHERRIPRLTSGSPAARGTINDTRRVK